MKTRAIISSLILVFSIFSFSAASAEWKNPFGTPSFAKDFRQKSEKKIGSRWTLSDWLAQKEKNRMMDLWLGMYSPSPYEFLIEGSTLFYKTKVDNPESETSYTSYSGALAFYALILGVEGRYENNSKENYVDTTGIINLRIAGNSHQGTHLNLQLGMRNRDFNTYQTSQQFSGADLDIYLAAQLGIHGNYRAYMPAHDKNLGAMTGSRWEAGVFLDFEYLRIFANSYSDKLIYTNSDVSTKNEKTGIDAGLRIYM